MELKKSTVIELKRFLNGITEKDSKGSSVMVLKNSLMMELNRFLNDGPKSVLIKCLKGSFIKGLKNT